MSDARVRAHARAAPWVQSLVAKGAAAAAPAPYVAEHSAATWPGIGSGDWDQNFSGGAVSNRAMNTAHCGGYEGATGDGRSWV